MNGRVFAVNRSPVLAWNIEPQLQVPYTDMPAAAAAAISPIVPAASDPYGRCWQNQVDAGTSFPYFGALYNNSLPPTAYRLQPGCMPNLGQFWPPTPPPDGCGRFDGSNLYFGPPVLRHAENISSNIRNSFPGLGHYSHLVETPKEQNQRLFKRETPISPNVSAPSISMCSSSSKSDNLNSCCVVDSKMKSQISIAHSLHKPELHTVSSCHEPYLCAPEIRSSSSMHPSTDKSCFSPSHSLKNNLNYHNASQDSIHRTKSMSVNQENCNASPLKNVYFSHYESENISSVHSKNFEKHSERQLQFDHKNSSFMNGNKPKNLHQSPNSYNLANYSSKKYDFQSGQEYRNGSPNSNVVRGERDSVVLIKEHYKQKSSSYKVKPEKSAHSDCKFQKSIAKSSVLIQGPESKNSDVFNIPTSVLHPKIEPSDKYFLSSCSSTVPSCMASYASSGPFLMGKDLPTDLRPSSMYQNSIYQNSCSFGKPWHYNELPAVSLDSYFQSPEAAKPPPSQNPPQVSSALHEGLISVAQTAPQDIEVTRVSGTMQGHVQPASFPKNYKSSEIDDEVQIIGVQTKNLSAKHEARCSLERKSIFHPPISTSQPLCLKQNKKEHEIDFPKSEPPPEELKKIKSPPSLCCETIILDEEDKKPLMIMKDSKQNNEKSITSNTEHSSVNMDCENTSSCIPLSIKQETPDEHESTLISCAEENKMDQHVSGNKESQDKKINLVCDPKTDIFQHADKVNVKVKKEQSQYQEVIYNENHGLNLLLNTIELQNNEHFNQKFSSPPSPNCQMNEPVDEINVRGLDLLSVIAGQRLISEFDIVKSEIDELGLKCNYPEVKESKLLSEDDPSKHTSEASTHSLKTSVFEIQSRLVELRRKYKQKQKELSRLKPKRRFANSYLKGRSNSVKDASDRNSISDTSSTTNENLNNSFCSSINDDDQETQNFKDLIEDSTDSKSKFESKTGLDFKSKRNSRSASIKRESSEETASTFLDRRITRRSLGKLTSGDKIFRISKESKSIKRNSRRTGSLKKTSSESILNSLSDVSQTSSLKSTMLNRNIPKKSSSLPENIKGIKVYSLRHSSQNLNKKAELSDVTDLVSKTISKKRKSDNPKKYIPSKQSKLSETIIAKHLRSRILFDTSGSMSDEDNLKDGVPDDLYDALMKCHLGDESNCASKLLKNIDSCNLTGPFGYPEPSLLNSEILVDGQRLLALEDGLFYAGYIKECQAPRKYGIALDGQRGNRLHIFTREELLTQAIVESKPLTAELPEGTRVCAYWSQQYRCLYPGVVGKAPCPSADWSEPRVFVLFDDGDSGQIPTKNIRLIPTDIIPIENISRTDPRNRSTSCYNRQRTSRRGRTRRLKCSATKNPNMKNSDASNENESKESSCASINESSCDDSCFIDYSLSPSHTPENHNGGPCSVMNSTGNAKLGKRQRKRSKRRTSHRNKLEQVDSAEGKDKCEAKTKRHKKYKDKHRRHHHHHHRHHHHHHHHHHSKKRKHKRKNAKSTSQDLENCIPCNSNLNSYEDIQPRAKACTDLIEHSSTVNLPQSEQNRVC